MEKSPCSYCKRADGTHTEGCRKGPCKLCAKRAPEKCSYHGGARLKPGTKTATAKQPKPAKREPVAGPMKFTANGSISAHIRGLVQAVAHGKAAEAELTAIRGALGG